jgi:hypothetical protein
MNRRLAHPKLFRPAAIGPVISALGLIADGHSLRFGFAVPWGGLVTIATSTRAWLRLARAAAP